MAATNYSIDILNSIRDGASTEYQDTIPQATRDNLATIGKYLETYTPLMNEFTGALIGKIVLTIFNSKLWENRLARFKQGEILDGSDVEEIFVEMINGVQFDPTGANPLGRRKPNNVHVLYHRQNFQEVFELTVSDEQVKMAFRSQSGVQTLATTLVQAAYSGANKAEYIAMKNLLATYQDGSGNYLYSDYNVAPITDQQSAKDFIKAARKAYLDVQFVTNQFNAAGVQTFTDPGDLVMLVNKDVIAEVDVEVLAAAFHTEDTEIIPEIVIVDNFGSMPDTYGLLIEKDFFRVFDTLRRVESIRNPQGLFTNYFLHVWQIHSLSKFKNAIRFNSSTTPSTAV